MHASGDLADMFSFRFSTKFCDPQTGLYWFGHRFYDPRIGRWISPDPLGLRGGINPYVMAINDPIDNWDYLGLSTANPSVEQECKETIDAFIGRNRALLQRLDFRFENNSLLPMNRWTTEQFEKAIEEGKRNCRIYWQCLCNCTETSSYEELGVFRKANRHETILSQQIGSEGNAPLYRNTAVYLAGGDITICANTAKSHEWERTFVHELQHARDHCRNDAIRSPFSNCASSDLSCDCKESLCNELRAFIREKPSMNSERVFRDKVVNSGYYTEGGNGALTSCLPFCRLAVSSNEHPLTLSVAAMFEELKSHCNLEGGLIPDSEIRFLTTIR